MTLILIGPLIRADVGRVFMHYSVMKTGSFSCTLDEINRTQNWKKKFTMH